MLHSRMKGAAVVACGDGVIKGCLLLLLGAGFPESPVCRGRGFGRRCGAGVCSPHGT